MGNGFFDRNGTMNLDNDAYFALGMLVAIVLIGGGLFWWLVSQIKR